MTYSGDVRVGGPADVRDDLHAVLEAADALRLRIEKTLRWSAMVPEHGATWPA